MKHDTSAAVAFLRRYRPGGPWVLTAIPPDGGRTATATFAEERAEAMGRWIDGHQGARNVYFHVGAGRRDSYGKKLEKADVGVVDHLHVDVDAPGAADDAWRSRTLERLRGHVPPPTAVVFSGGGYGAFWRLAEPVQLPDEKDPGWADAVAEVESRNKALSEALGGDHCHDVSRLMRLPGTINVPSEKKRAIGRVEALAELVEESGDSYELDVFPRAEGGVGAPSSTREQALSVDLPADLPRLADVRDLDDYTHGIEVSGYVKRAIEQGDYERFGGDRSKAVFWVCCELVRCEVPDEVIGGVITDPRFEISAHVRAQGDVRRYVSRQVWRAKSVLAEGEMPVGVVGGAADLSEKHAQTSDSRVSAFDVKPDSGVPSRFDDEVAEINQEYFVIMHRGRVGYFENGRLCYLAYDHFKNGVNNRTVDFLAPGKGGKMETKVVPLGDHWMRHPRRRTYRNVIFKPGGQAPTGFLNLWRGWPVAPDPSHDEAELREKCRCFLAHVMVNICRGRQVAFDYILDYIAHTLQRPWEPPHTVLVFRSVEGIGKGVFNECVGSLFGPHYVPIHDAQSMTGKFNAQLEHAIWVFADEAFFAGNRKDADKLKSLTGSSTIQIEPKGLEARHAPRYFRTCMASNHKHVIQAAREDRRHMVLEATLDIAGVNLELEGSWETGPSFFDAVTNEWASGGREAFAALMRDRDLSNFNRFVRPETEELNEQRALSLADVHQKMLRRLQTAEMPIAATEGHGERLRVFVPTRGLVDTDGEADLAGLFGACGFNRDTRGEVAGWWLPTLEQARSSFARVVGIDINWKSPPDAWPVNNEVL